MLISIDERATHWFNKEYGFNKPFALRMFPQYAGFGEKNKGFTLAFSAETPTNAGYVKEMNGITFYVEGNDEWFFKETETYLTANALLDEIQITFKEHVPVN
ncbi:HesB/YadR/YfhF family protein [Bacillus sp. MRMR6]|uniref:HesB/YadR/YfhF family protein n=1 Tax=Bacillus sp. MRMR6 TaxID=1928617 RepID=UPI000953170F|nr:hypothetical protein [Bacillus sp. MRMR6]OLS33609.1 hypothetical protein BTR25_24955 [Bacillus sp. MRMR6]